MNLGLTRQADNAEVLLLVLGVQLREWEQLEDTISASECSTEIALSDFPTFEVGFCLATYTTRLLCHE